MARLLMFSGILHIPDISWQISYTFSLDFLNENQPYMYNHLVDILSSDVFSELDSKYPVL